MPGASPNDDDLAQRAREAVVLCEGLPHYSGLAGHDLEALAQGIHESTDEPPGAHDVGQPAPTAAGSSR